MVPGALKENVDFFGYAQAKMCKRDFFRDHYYPFGLPMAGMGSAAAGFKENRRKYQSNEYIKDFGLNWMDFHARQYDPQLGRFLGVDPLATSGGQDKFSPYAAMGNAPESMVDPNGTIFTFGSAGIETSFKALQAANEAKMAAYSLELGSLDLFSSKPEVQKQISQLNALINMHQAFRDQLKAMDESPVEFHISNNAPHGNNAAETFYDFENGRVQFNFGGDNPWQPTLAHELRHGYGYLVGELSGVRGNVSQDPLYDMMDEVEANLTGYLFRSDPSPAVDGSYGVENFRPSTKKGGTYPQLDGKDIQITTKTSISVFQSHFNDTRINNVITSFQNPNGTVGDLLNYINSRYSNRYVWGDNLKK